MKIDLMLAGIIALAVGAWIYVSEPNQTTKRKEKRNDRKA